MVNILGSVPIRRSENVKKKSSDGKSKEVSAKLADGILLVMSFNDQQERDNDEGKPKDNSLGQFVRGIKDPSESEVDIEDTVA